MKIINALITFEKLKDDVLSFKLFFVICLIGVSSLISWGVSKAVFGFAKDSAVFALISSLASIVIFAPVAGVLLGSDTFTGAGREFLLSCVSRKTYLLSRWVAASIMLIAGVLVSTAIPLATLFSRNGVEFNGKVLFAILCFLLFSILFISVSTCFSVLTNSTVTSLIIGGIYTTVEIVIGIVGYLSNKDFLYYLSPHALVIRGVFPESGQIAVQLTSAVLLLLYSALPLWFAVHYGERRDI